LCRIPDEGVARKKFGSASGLADENVEEGTRRDYTSRAKTADKNKQNTQGVTMYNRARKRMLESQARWAGSPKRVGQGRRHELGTARP